MRSLALSSLFFVASLALATSAAANPMWISASHGLQVPETFHVQVTAMIDGGFGDLDRPLYVKQGDHILQFVDGDYIFGENTGSGVATVTALQVCDCDVQPGSYTYEFIYAEGGDNWDTVYPVTVLVTNPPPVATIPTTPSDDISEDAEMNPWDIPSPPWPKGVDCVAWCANPPPPVDQDGNDLGPDPKDVVQDDTHPVQEVLSFDSAQSADQAATTDIPIETAGTGNLGDDVKTDEPSCSTGVTATPTALPCVLLFGALLLLAALRDRRTSIKTRS